MTSLNHAWFKFIHVLILNSRHYYMCIGWVKIRVVSNSFNQNLKIYRTHTMPKIRGKKIGSIENIFWHNEL